LAFALWHRKQFVFKKGSTIFSKEEPAERLAHHARHRSPVKKRGMGTIYYYTGRRYALA
jgi:hypothetical protein